MHPSYCHEWSNLNLKEKSVMWDILASLTDRFSIPVGENDLHLPHGRSSVLEDSKERFIRSQDRIEDLSEAEREALLKVAIERHEAQHAHMLEDCEMEHEVTEETSVGTWEDHDNRGHIAYEFRHENYPKVKRKKARRIGKLAKKARRK